MIPVMEMGGGMGSAEAVHALAYRRGRRENAGRDFISRTLERDAARLTQKAVVTFNNQNTVIMKLELETGRFVLLHDNRLFLFRSSKECIEPHGRDRIDGDAKVAVDMRPAKEDTEMAVSLGRDDGVEPYAWDAEMTSRWIGGLFSGEHADLYQKISKRLGITGRVLLFDLDDNVLKSDFDDMPLVHRRIILRHTEELRRASGLTDEHACSELPEPSDFAEKIMLHFLTSPKYRILNTLYFFFRTADSILLLTIIVLTMMQYSKRGVFELVIPSYKQYTVLSAIGLELFSDIMHSTSKFWFLERLSVYVGMCLYAVYFLIAYHNLGDKMFGKDAYVTWVLVIRLVAFVFEECLDIAIDCEMHNDWLLVCEDWTQPPEGGRKYTDIRRSIDTLPFKPTKDFFMGSKSAWLPWSAFDEDTYHRRRMWRFRWLYALPIVLLLLPALAMLALVAVPALFFLLADLIARRTCRGWRSNLWYELWHNY